MTGALPSQHILKLIRNGSIKNGNEANIQPASLDLTVGEKIYRLPYIFLPKSDQNVEETAREIGAEPFGFEYPLEVNVKYLVKLKEELELPKEVYGYANPKSSVGRLDLRVSMLADRVSRFDSAGEKGYKGTLWAVIEPKSFRVKIAPGDTLLQLRLFYSDSRLGDREIEKFYEDFRPIFIEDKPFEREQIKINDRDGSLILTAGLENELIGWRCEKSSKFLDFSKRNYYDPKDFFTPIYKPKEQVIILRKGDFYIFYTREKLRVPPGFAAEIEAMDVRSGEYRSHYAGFIDPGFGYGKNGEVKGMPIVLEMRPYEDDIVLRNKQPICKIAFERVAETPDIVYGEEKAGSHYATQSGPRLSKHFRT
ncbi:MAG: 2'-deoxycytidine 5'-triphosphate deaminase [bacterium]|nr:2'-deoxycytidine 5'-triphosphate deaminase [bacterium]